LWGLLRSERGLVSFRQRLKPIKNQRLLGRGKAVMEIYFETRVQDAYQYVPHFVARIPNDKIDAIAGSDLAVSQEFLYLVHHF
jgi:hypothetical protein